MYMTLTWRMSVKFCDLEFGFLKSQSFHLTGKRQPALGTDGARHAGIADHVPPGSGPPPQGVADCSPPHSGHRAQKQSVLMPVMPFQHFRVSCMSMFHRMVLCPSESVGPVFVVAEFVPHIGKLFDESVLIGTGWTTHESLRSDIAMATSVPTFVFMKL